MAPYVAVHLYRLQNDAVHIRAAAMGEAVHRGAGGRINR